MAWRLTKVEEQRLKAIKACIEKSATKTAICKVYDVSRPTLDKWLKVFLEHGEKGLKDKSKKPHKVNTLYTDDQFNRAIDLKLRKRRWGPKKIQAVLKTVYPDENWPSPTRLYEVFKEHHLIASKRIRNRIPTTAPLKDCLGCNDTWAIDFKGEFMTGDNYKFAPLTITDCFTRYLIECAYLAKHSVEYVWPIFEEMFHEYGLPLRIRSDNGPPFGSCGAGRLTRLSVYFLKAGVMPEWIKPGHPEQNGRHERFHLTLKQEIATPPKDTLPLQIQAMKDFQKEYNFERPHESLDMKTPGSIYQPSPRKWDGLLRAPEYDTKIFDVRKVEGVGRITLKGHRIFISETLKGEYVGLRMNEKEELECYYGPIYLGMIKDGFEKPKMQDRIKKRMKI